MSGPGSVGRMLVAAGVLLVVLGVALLVAERFPGLRIGRLPGDFRLERGSFRVYVPLATSILLSLLLSLLLWLFGRR